MRLPVGEAHGERPAQVGADSGAGGRGAPYRSRLARAQGIHAGLRARLGQLDVPVELAATGQHVALSDLLGGQRLGATGLIVAP